MADGKDTSDGATATLDPGVEKTRAWTGLGAVLIGDVVIVIAVIVGIIYVGRTASASGAITAILSSGFTAIGTMTTAYFGIKSMANTASNIAAPAAPAPEAPVPVPTANPATAGG